MKVYEVSKELGLSNKEILDALNENGSEKKSHTSSITDIEYAFLKDKFVKEVKYVVKEEVEKPVEKKEVISAPRKFQPGDSIQCKCVRPNKVNAIGSRTKTKYTWDGYGEIIDVDYADIQAWKASKKRYLFDPQIIIEDEELYKQWEKDFKDLYSNYIGLDYPEQFFDINDNIFRERLKTYPKTLQNLIKIQATKMIKDGEFNSLTKLSIIDEELGTDMKDFL